MIRIEQYNKQYELYTYNELSDSAKNVAQVHEWLDAAENFQYTLQQGHSIDIDVPNTWDKLEEFELSSNVYELIPYFDYNENGKVSWATCSFTTPNVLYLLDYNSHRYLKDKYNLTYHDEIKVDIHYVSKSTHPIIELTEVELNIPNEREFIEEYMSIVVEEAKDKLDEINKEMALDIQTYLDNNVKDIIFEYEDYQSANSMSEFINKNDIINSTVTLFEISGKPVTVWLDNYKEI